jgi:hypothetical protein
MRRAIVLVLWVGAIGNAQAQVPIGRLFNTPEERARLDALRAADGMPAPPPPPPPAPARPPAPPLQLDGILRRASGPSTVWINGVPQAVQPDKISPPGTKPALTMQLDSGKKIKLKPGQRYNQEQERINDVNEP